MACKHPLKGWKVGLTENGKDKYKITDYSIDYVIKDLKSDKLYFFQKNEPKIYPGSPSKEIITDFIEIPCGKCLGCRLTYARTWADRCMLESTLYPDHSWFVTLTYDDAHIPQSFYVDETTGEYFESYTLRKRDMQLFMKRLRQHFRGYQIRFYGCGEYGGSTFRPHFHLLLFNLPDFYDLTLYKVNNGNFYYNSDELQSIWKNGYAVLTPVSYATCAYTCRYVMKKAVGQDKEYYTKFGLEPEFVLMSRNPGLGKHWLDANINDFFEYDYYTLPSSKKPVKVFSNRYFDSVLEKKNPALLKSLKEKRLQNAKEKTAMKLDKTDLSYLEMLEVEENSLKRNVNFKRENRNA